MSFWRRIASSNFIIRLTHWEYWPFGIIQFPAIAYWLWLSLKARSALFFTASNPGIPMGGMFGESKFDILSKIPPAYIPKTVRINFPASRETVLNILSTHKFSLPVIFKPDLGERGFMVERIINDGQIDSYLKRVKVDFIIQELVDLAQEFGIFYRRFPDESQGEVISVVMKEMLTVTGDGRSTLKELILSRDRAKLQWKSLQHRFQDRLSEVLPAGKSLELVSIGNHARGTKFLNGNHLINDQLSQTFDGISRQIPGFYYGRFDLRCASVAALYAGDIKILELNGCGAERAHIYDPDFSLIEAMVVNVKHWSDIYRIATTNRKRGLRFATWSEASAYYQKFKEATRE